MNETGKQNRIHPRKPRRKRLANPRKPQRPTGARAHAADTRERILDAAEQLFGEHGVDATSIRDITRAARANLGAVNYYFDTKQKLVAEVFKRRLDPVMERQAALLDEVLSKAGDKPPSIEAVFDAMIRPTVENSFSAGKPNIAFSRLLERSFSDPDSLVRRLMRDLMQKVKALPVKSLARTWPSLPPEELLWRIVFMNGALHAMLRAVRKKDLLPPAMQEGLDADTMIQRLVTFAAAGIRART